MQEDMHYFGVFALARSAGIKTSAARVIATASQYVDDAIWERDLFLDDGRSILMEMTAHKLLDLKNADAEDQRKVWLPFHFLPGGVGSKVTEKLVCEKNSAIAREMAKHSVEVAAEAPYGLQLLGICAHVYADTFSHYGFIGANHTHNAIRKDSIQLEVNEPGILDYIQTKANELWGRALSFGMSQVFPLGHGAAATFPDRPYLRWAYTRADGKRIRRDNPSDFLEGAKSLRKLFDAYLDVAPHDGEARTAKPWQKIRPAVKKILEREGTAEERIKAWKGAMSQGELTRNHTTIPGYQGASWSDSINKFYDCNNPNIPPGSIARLPVYRFYQAARLHRAHILGDSLAARGVIAA